ncbi:MAG: hypothetical protein LBG98_03230 [Puniceicoccales bacterium]|jgi:hypothetical protein|nr:hypothetical protein [Puniceicoccales bacterium]
MDRIQQYGRGIAIPRLHSHSAVETSCLKALTQQQNEVLDKIKDKLQSIPGGQELTKEINNALAKIRNRDASGFEDLQKALMKLASTLGRLGGSRGLNIKDARKILDAFCLPSIDLVPDTDQTRNIVSSPLSGQELCDLVDNSMELERDVKMADGASVFQGHEVFNLLDNPDLEKPMAVVYKGQDGTLMAINVEEGEDTILRAKDGKPQRLDNFINNPNNKDVQLLVLPDSVVPEKLKAAATPEVTKAERPPVVMTIGEVKYAIPADGIPAGMTDENVKEEITRGLELLGQINNLDSGSLLENSPIGSREDMVSLTWALDAKAWKVSLEFQRGSSSMYVSDEDHKIYNALKGAKDENGKSFAYSRGGENDSSHLKPFPTSKATQYGFDAYGPGQSATAPRDVKLLLPYGRNTLLFGELKPDETGFSKNRTFIKLEGAGIDSRVTGFRARWNSLTNLVSHGLGWVKKVLLKMNDLTRGNDFRENATPVSKMVSSFFKNYDGPMDENTLKGIKSAAGRGLTALARHIQSLKDAPSTSNQVAQDIQNLENAISAKLGDSRKGILKDYQQEAINQWKQTPEGHGQSTLAYFSTHDQSGKELVLDL